MPLVVGASVLLTATFRDEEGQPSDPDGVTGKTRSPAGIVTDYAIGEFAHPSDGVYTLRVVPDEDGEWDWRIAGTGGITAAAEGKFVINPSVFP